MVRSEAGPGAARQGERQLELTVSWKTERNRVLQPHLMVAQRSPPWGRHQPGWGIYGLSPHPPNQDAEVAPWDVAFLGTGPFIFLKLLPNLLLLPAGHASLSTGWVLSPSLSLVWPPGRMTVIKEISNLLMELLSPAGEHFPITWTYLLSLIFQ